MKSKPDLGLKSQGSALLFKKHPEYLADLKGASDRELYEPAGQLLEVVSLHAREWLERFQRDIRNGALSC